MRLPHSIRAALYRRAMSIATTRPPDFVIGGSERPYVRRWWVIPRNRLFNIYLHKLLRDDDDRALHDHPWPNLSIILAGGYAEITPSAGMTPLAAARVGLHDRRIFLAGRLRFRWATAAHRLERLPSDEETWSLFITGPVLRPWGFWCTHGWRHWREYTNTADGGATVGRGCE